VLLAGGMLLLAWMLGERAPWHALLLAALVLLSRDPHTLADEDVQLSFAAVRAIFLVAGQAATHLRAWLSHIPTTGLA
jgi:predicted membrane metal-binding protein